ncbi:hypothetical protein FACS1894159_04980 [Bacteroidia bacterium]|nr:hypothetical protein FACS1894159_04980 [Bacteroidia bacterium]
MAVACCSQRNTTKSAPASSDKTAATSVQGPLTERYWKLTELGGKPVKPSGQQKEAHLIFKAQDGGVSGCAGCNNLTGAYTLEGQKLTFGNVASTKMMCLDMSTEDAFVKIFTQVASYGVQGDRMWLNDASGKTLASFVEVLMK